MLLINKVLAAVPDQETFYDITDCLEDQGMKQISEKLLQEPSTDPILVEQLRIYEVPSLMLIFLKVILIFPVGQLRFRNQPHSSPGQWVI